MALVKVKQLVNAPVSRVWESWDNYADIYRFNPNLKKSYLIGDSADTGRGATRQCDFADGKNYVRERLIEYVPGKKLVVDIYDGTVPLKSATATITLSPIGSEKTEVTMAMEFVPKMGLLGRLLVPLMKIKFGNALRGLLAGNAAYVERGVEIVR
ncbi:MAG: hypothetical protein COC23_05585 [Hyphomicrobiales bacterium]|nr:MAG: hypothetical protein COC23_05585 [Hyphomicrobiales bacterium]